MPERSTLAEFAAQQVAKSTPRCLLCAVPADVEAEARAGKTAGVTYRVLGEWLAHLGYADIEKPPSKGRLEKHFQFNHSRTAE